MENLKTKSEAFSTEIFWVMFQNALILGIFAFSGAFIGWKLDNMYATGKQITILLIIVSFLVSWTIIIVRYFKLKKRLRESKLK